MFKIIDKMCTLARWSEAYAVARVPQLTCLLIMPQRSCVSMASAMTFSVINNDNVNHTQDSVLKYIISNTTQT